MYLDMILDRWVFLFPGTLITARYLSFGSKLPRQSPAARTAFAT
jgi:hypothetical protein